MITKQEAYQKLFIIKNRGVDVIPVLKELTMLDEPNRKILEFIMTYEKIDQEEFYQNLRGKNNSKQSRLYSQLLREDVSDYELSKSISSLITQSIIFSESMSDQDKFKFYSHMRVKECIDALNDYLMSMNPIKLREIKASIVKDIKLLIK